MSDFYDPGSEIGVIWNDTDLNIDWPVKVEDAILSAKDIKLPSFREFPRLTW
ncbi:dTDP-4-dehydrorhamnose 3,5-epimerase family protein [Acinetobacter baumannii]